MSFFTRLVYRFFIFPLALLLVHLTVFFNKRIRNAVVGRYRSVKILTSFLPEEKKTILIHASSLGEFEHIRPVIHHLGKQYQIIVTFFSPSGYEHAKKTYPDEIHVYQPFDFYRLWKKILKRINPRLIIISKHDIWPNQIYAAKKLNIPVFLVNASLSKGSSRLNAFYRFLLKDVYKNLDKVYAISDEDKERFIDYFGIKNISVTGDTKFDQALIRKEKAFSKNLLNKKWTEEAFVFVLGSIWQEDYNAINDSLQKLITKYDRIKVIFVPHQPEEHFIQTIKNQYDHVGVSLYSQREKLQDQRVLIVDVVGVLADLYQYADIAYVGGSFKQGIHNVMEAAVYGIPVIYGPKYENSYEAAQLVKEKSAFVVRDKEDFLKISETLFSDADYRKETGAKVELFVRKKTGTTRKLLEEWEPILQRKDRQESSES
ncbi:MAG: glycosyltransferase [Calditrichaeota bacterium]|nr:glycosyltransferase [Calditrichota bacterium]